MPVEQETGAIGNRMTEFLYRFISPPKKGSQDEALLRNIITTNTIRLSNPRYFNDPFDCRMTFAKGSTSLSGIRDYFDTTFGRYGTPEEKTLAEKTTKFFSLFPGAAIEKLRGIVITGQNDTRLDANRFLCLFQPTDNSMPDDLLLWSHYADGHRGICLQFDKAILLANYLCKPVTYTTNLPSFEEYAAADGESFAELVVFRKAKQWEYENEWRILIPADKTDNDMIVLPQGAISGIVIGCEVDPCFQAQIIQWSRESALALYKTCKDDIIYGLKIEPFNVLGVS